MLAVSKRGAWHEWVLFFLRGVAKQAADAVKRAKRLQDLREDWRGRLTKIGGTLRLLNLADNLFESPVLTVRQVNKLWRRLTVVLNKM